MFQYWWIQDTAFQCNFRMDDRWEWLCSCQERQLKQAVSWKLSYPLSFSLHLFPPSLNLHICLHIYLCRPFLHVLTCMTCILGSRNMKSGYKVMMLYRNFPGLWRGSTKLFYLATPCLLPCLSSHSHCLLLIFISCLRWPSAGLCLSATASQDNGKLSMFSTLYRKVPSICSFTIPSFSPLRHTGNAKSYTDWDCSHLEMENQDKQPAITKDSKVVSSENTEVTSSP